MKAKKTVLPILLSAAMTVCAAFGAAGCANASTPASEAPKDYVEECYNKLKYIDENLSDRDSIAGEQHVKAQKWITSTLTKAGYSKDLIGYQDVPITKYYKESNLESVAVDYTTDGKKYNKSGRNYVEAEDGEYVNATFTSQNIILKKDGKSDKQIIVGAHYDGDGTGDNGSGVSLALTMAEKLYSVETHNDITFIFFTSEEYGCYGSTAYANAMTENEIANTLYMINMDSLVCGDYCYLYGGVQDNANKVVTQTEAYDNAMAVAKSLGLDFKSNPWTWDNLSPADQKAGKTNPSYASPSTGNWSDHKGFKNKGIQYVYFEATNWEIPDYTGYGETYLFGMLMNTENDYLENIEFYFPGRIKEHFTKFYNLLYALLIQPKVNI